MAANEFIKCNDCNYKENVENITKYIKEKHPWMADNIVMNISECPRCGSKNIQRVTDTLQSKYIKISEQKLKKIFKEVLDKSGRKLHKLENSESTVLYVFQDVLYWNGFWGFNNYTGVFKIFTDSISFQTSSKNYKKINFELGYDKIKDIKIDSMSIKIFTEDKKYKFATAFFLKRVKIRPQEKKRLSELTEQEKIDIATEYNNITEALKSIMTKGIENYNNQKDGYSLRETMLGIKSGYEDTATAICEKYNITIDTLNTILKNKKKEEIAVKKTKQAAFVENKKEEKIIKFSLDLTECTDLYNSIAKKWDKNYEWHRNMFDERYPKTIIGNVLEYINQTNEVVKIREEHKELLKSFLEEQTKKSDIHYVGNLKESMTFLYENIIDFINLGKDAGYDAGQPMYITVEYSGLKRFNLGGWGVGTLEAPFTPTRLEYNLGVRSNCYIYKIDNDEFLIFDYMNKKSFDILDNAEQKIRRGISPIS